ncbi:MAG: hypothetical protein J1E40_10535 [Oscillospiraceae bacterium]|nr:hypothetical protein [Oscillospiraceae bacterium]
MRKRFIMQNEDHLMRWKILSVLLILSVCFFTLPVRALTAETDDDGQIMPLAAAYTYSGGYGTSGNPYKISSRSDLEAIANAVNSGDDMLGVYFQQTRDIDLGGANNPWPTIGITIDNAAHQFRGVFDGGQYQITGLYVDRDDDDAGLFGYVGENGIIKNVNIIEPDVSGTFWCGALAGRNYGLIEYCSTTDGSVYGSQQFIGGLVGDNHGGTVSYCYNNGTFVEFDQIGGGLVGRNSGGTVENCYNRGDVWTNNLVRGYAGGVVGENTAGSTVDNCYSTGEVNGNMACGSVVGANGAGSSVTNCYYPDDLEPGVGSSTGNMENVTPKSEEEFSSGEVAWELSKGNNGEGWGQTLDGEDGAHDNHPHFTEVADKPYDTTPVYRVTFKSNNPKIDLKYYVDPDSDVEIPDLSENPNAKWYVNGEEFDGKKINEDKDAIAGVRILFSGEMETIPVTTTYSTAAQQLTVNLDSYMGYENGGSASGRFEYKITEDPDELNATLNINGKVLTIPAGADVKDGGYTLKINAHEKEAYIAPLSMGGFGTGDVTLTVNIIIEKATPVIVIKPEASAIPYDTTLADSALTGGEAQHPTTKENVPGTFRWTDSSIKPSTISEAAIVGYSVTFEPADTRNYNDVIIFVTLEVNKIDPVILKYPQPIDSTYNGSAQDLIIPGDAEGGTMKYWLEDPIGSAPPADNSAYSSTIPARANAGTYTIWYKVVGDENHNDTVPDSITAIINPYPVTITPGNVTYNGSSIFNIPLDVTPGSGSPETIVATLTTDSKNADRYEYNASSGSKYTAELSSPNYVLQNAYTLTIDPLAAVLKWGKPLTFFYDGIVHSVTANVSNGINGDVFDLKYTDNESSAEGKHIADVTDLGNPNYILDYSQNTQVWYIIENNENVTLTAPDHITYGDDLTLTFTIAPLMEEASLEDVYFYANGSLLGTIPVTRMDNNTGIAALTIKATSENNFSAGANAVIALHANSPLESDAVTIDVNPKPITPVITAVTGDIVAAATKTYDGNNAASGLDIELNPFEICDYSKNAGGKDEVTISASGYTYNDPNAGINKTIRANDVILSGAQSGNYVIEHPAAITGIINQKVVGLEWRGVTGLVYTGDPANVNATAIELIPGDVCTVVVENGSQINAYTYTARAARLSNSNYCLPDNFEQDYTIDPAKLYIPDQTVQYNGNTTFNVRVDGVTPTNKATEKVAVELITSSPDIGDYAYVDINTLDVGDKPYTASTTDTNYNIAGGAILTIVRARTTTPTLPGTPAEPNNPTVPGVPDEPTVPDEPDNPAEPNEPDEPTDPNGSRYPNGTSSRPTGAVFPAGQSNPDDKNNNYTANDEDDNYSEDVSANSAAYAANENIGIGSSSYANIINIIFVISALTFILKKKYPGQKDKH